MPARLTHLFYCLVLCFLLLLSACEGSMARSPSPSPAPEPSPEAPPADDGEPGEPGEEPGGPSEPPQPEAGQLTAGEWRDLDNWTFWLELMNSKDWSDKQTHWGFYPTEKVSVEVAGTAKAVNAVVILKDSENQMLWQTRTDVTGQATLFPQLFDSSSPPYSLQVTAGQETVTVQDVELNAAKPIQIELSAPEPLDALDLMFVIDTTGSMGDELEYLKVELQDVIDRVKKDNANLDLRLSANYYRDLEDAYVVRSFPFTTNVKEVVSQMAKQRASGGGDYPEAVDKALEDALNNHSWRSDAKARLLFLVLDAPPHHEQAAISRVQTLSAEAAKQGIKIIPLASSGVDKETEFLLRFISIATGGSYTFLTNDSGIGNEKIEPTIGEYQVEFLNDLLVRIIRRHIK